MSDNSHGKGYMGIANVYWYDEKCALHWQEPKPWTAEDEKERSKHRCEDP